MWIKRCPVLGLHSLGRLVPRTESSSFSSGSTKSPFVDDDVTSAHSPPWTGVSWISASECSSVFARYHRFAKSGSVLPRSPFLEASDRASEAALSLVASRIHASSIAGWMKNRAPLRPIPHGWAAFTRYFRAWETNQTAEVRDCDLQVHFWSPVALRVLALTQSPPSGGKEACMQRCI